MSNKRDVYICDARHGYVHFQDSYGAFAEHTSSWHTYGRIYSRIPQKSTYTDIRLRFTKRRLFGFFALVDALRLYLDASLGRGNASSE